MSSFNDRKMYGRKIFVAGFSSLVSVVIQAAKRKSPTGTNAKAKGSALEQRTPPQPSKPQRGSKFLVRPFRASAMEVVRVPRVSLWAITLRSFGAFGHAFNLMPYATPAPLHSLSRNCR